MDKAKMKAINADIIDHVIEILTAIKNDEKLDQVSYLQFSAIAQEATKLQGRFNDMLCFEYREFPY